MPRASLLVALLATGCLYNKSLYDDRVEAITDADGDGYARADDCDDDDATAFPSADEVPADGIDQDCDGGDLCHADTDGDGFGSAALVASTDLDCDDDGESADTTDCDPADPEVFPGADEVFYDGVDQNCTPEDDDDADGDGFAAYDLDGTDCDDTDAELHPGLHRTFEVPSTDYPTIQSAIDATCDGDVVQLADQVFEESIDLGHRDISVLGTGWTSLRGAPDDNGPVVRLSRGTLDTMWIEQHDSTEDGSCIRVEHGKDVYIGAHTSRCTTTGDGGGVYVSDSAGVTIRNQHNDDEAGGDGGGVYVRDSSDVHLTGLTLQNNKAGRNGGGLYLEGIDGVWFREQDAAVANSAGEAGGAFYLTDVTGIDSDLVLLFSNRSADVGSSAAIAGASAGRIRDWAVVDSMGEGQAALYLQGHLDLGNLFVVNSEGAGIYVVPNAGDDVTLQNLLLLNNASTALVVRSDVPHALTITNSILAYNKGYGLLSTGTADPDVSYSDLFANDGDNYSGLPDMFGIEGNLESDPRFLQYPSTLNLNATLFLLGPDSTLKHVGNPELLNPDGSRSDMGMWAGPDALYYESYDDVDEDALYDGWESEYGLDPATDDAALDPDGDGLTSAEEFALGTIPTSYDSDGDGASDDLEVDVGTDPIDKNDTAVDPSCVQPTDPADLQPADLALSGTVGWGDLWVDHTYVGMGFQVGGEHHCTGVFAHAPSLIHVTIPPGCHGLSGSIGIAAFGVGACGDGAVFRIRQDASLLWESGTQLEAQVATPFGTLAVVPGTVDLEVDPLTDNACDQSAWLDLLVDCGP